MKYGHGTPELVIVVQEVLVKKKTRRAIGHWEIARWRENLVRVPYKQELSSKIWGCNGTIDTIGQSWEYIFLQFNSLLWNITIYNG